MTTVVAGSVQRQALKDLIEECALEVEDLAGIIAERLDQEGRLGDDITKANAAAEYVRCFNGCIRDGNPLNAKVAADTCYTFEKSDPAWYDGVSETKFNNRLAELKGEPVASKTPPPSDPIPNATFLVDPILEQNDAAPADPGVPPAVPALEKEDGREIGLYERRSAALKVVLLKKNLKARDAAVLICTAEGNADKAKAFAQQIWKFLSGKTEISDKSARRLEEGLKLEPDSIFIEASEKKVRAQIRRKPKVKPPVVAKNPKAVRKPKTVRTARKVKTKPPKAEKESTSLTMNLPADALVRLLKAAEVCVVTLTRDGKTMHVHFDDIVMSKDKVFKALSLD